MSGVGTPVDVSPIYWHGSDKFTLTITLNVHLNERGPNLPGGWWGAEREAKESIRRRFREARESLHQGRPR